ncbi:MAG: hypothetical protein JWM59_3364 [Verrucomicrobiales bacterium]|nr:hypothetical protein [Verrucomicrobiales bacterium]
MSETTPSLTDGELDALLASGGTGMATMMAVPLEDNLERRLKLVAEMLSSLASLPPEASLITMHGPEMATVTLVRESLIVGRSASCGLIFQTDKGLSKKHFEVFPQDGEYFLRDLNSTNGTKLNDRPCLVGEVRHLLDGDVILAGGRSLVFLSAMNRAPLPRPPEP